MLEKQLQNTRKRNRKTFSKFKGFLELCLHRSIMWTFSRCFWHRPIRHSSAGLSAMIGPSNHDCYQYRNETIDQWYRQVRSNNILWNGVTGEMPCVVCGSRCRGLHLHRRISTHFRARVAPATREQTHVPQEHLGGLSYYTCDHGNTEYCQGAE